MISVYACVRGKVETMKIAIVGAGKLGLKVAEALLGGDHSVTVIDKDAETLQKISYQMDVMTVNANAKEVSVLRELHMSSFDFLLATTDRDEKNIVIASFAKKLGCSRVIARVRDPEHMHQFGFIRDTMSIDIIVNPDMAITNEIYKYLIEKYTLSNGIFSSGKVSLIEFRSDRLSKLIGKTIRQTESILDDMLVAAVSRNGKVIIPEGDTVIHPHDDLYLCGKKAPIMALNKKVHEKGKYTDLQKVMIIGGGKTGLFLAQKLSEFGISVKIIERDKNQCYYLAKHLENVMILHGDGTDINLLEDENIDDMDAFVTATGYDEDNLLLALMAKNRGIEDVIAKVSRGIYTGMVADMGVDMALNPLDISASNILRLIQGSRRVIASQLIQGQAEVMEIIITDDMKLLHRSIGELDLPHGVIIGAIHRGMDVIIPNGETVIQEGDRVMIISLLSEVAALEKVFRTGGHTDFLR